MKDPQAHIDLVRVQDGSVTYQAQRLCCSHPNCKETFNMKKKGVLKPPEAVCRMAKNKGWLPDLKKGGHLCSIHNPNSEDQKPMAHTTRPLPKASPTPREMTVQDRRTIFREIDDCYDESRQAYVFEVTDKTIAEKLKMPWGWVAKVREENFGPAGPDPRIGQIIDRLETLSKQVALLEKRALETAEEAETIAKELRESKAKMEALI